MLTKLFSYGVLLLISTHPPKTHPITGDWYTAGNESKITVAPCGTKYCGTISWLKNPAAAPKNSGVGTLIIKDFDVIDSNTMEKGKIHDPRNGKWYSGRLQIGDDGRLEVRGWLGMPALGKTVYWTRAN